MLDTNIEIAMLVAKLRAANRDDTHPFARQCGMMIERLEEQTRNQRAELAIRGEQIERQRAEVEEARAASRLAEERAAGAERIANDQLRRANELEIELKAAEEHIAIAFHPEIGWAASPDVLDAVTAERDQVMSDMRRMKQEQAELARQTAHKLAEQSDANTRLAVALAAQRKTITEAAKTLHEAAEMLEYWGAFATKRRQTEEGLQTLVERFRSAAKGLL